MYILGVKSVPLQLWFILTKARMRREIRTIARVSVVSVLFRPEAQFQSEGDPMTRYPITSLMILALLFTGCYTQSFLANDQPPPDSTKVIFHLLDGREISSPAGQRRRVDEGYQIVGYTITEKQYLEKYEGIILDSEIKGISSSAFNAQGTVLLAIGVAVTLAVILTRLN
jgi:hypothetical protein